MNNKKLGAAFEKEVVDLLIEKGFWVHFISPDRRGAQPFDIIAVKRCVPIAIDCKTSVSHIFSINRLEDNQVMAFERWLACGNTMPLIFVKHNGSIYVIRYDDLKQNGKVDVLKEIKVCINDILEMR